jgi:hypothetical protein
MGKEGVGLERVSVGENRELLMALKLLVVPFYFKF